MAEPERRRRRPAVSCTLCRRRKIRCNRETPCSNCVRSRNEACVYENLPPQHRPRHSGHGLSIAHDGASSASTASTAPDAESMRSRIRQLEEQLQKSSQAPAPTSDPNIDVATYRIGGTFFFHATRPVGGRQAVIRTVSHKSRLFGQSHWMNFAFALVRDFIDVLEDRTKEGVSKIYPVMQRCKRLAKAIKTERCPAWPCPPTPDLPPKDIADELVDRYLCTSETVYRVLHVPTFRRDYDALWETGAEPNETFLVQLKLVLAIGAATYDYRFSLRPSAIRWLYEAELWLSNPALKSRLGIQYIQINILYLLAREAVAVGEDLVWISAGSLFRTAVYMGLHRDPARLPSRPTFAAEMHRRLWGTVMELMLQSSLNAGGPPLLGLEDFDTEPPGNFSDEQLTSEGPASKPENEFTQVSVAIALRKTLPARLAVARFLNHFASSGTYEETLRLDAELRASYKALRQTLQSFDPRTDSSPSGFELRMVDLLMHRYILALHNPFFGLAFEETAYAFSRKVVVDAALKIWYAANPASAIGAAARSGETILPGQDSLERLVACGNGFLRSAVLQAVLVISVELKTQLQEEDSLGPMPLRPDLLSVMEDAKTWSMWCIEAGETNVKGYIFICVMAAQIEGLVSGIKREELPALLVKAGEEAAERCLSVLENMTDCGHAEQTPNELDQTSLDMAPELFEDWDFIMSDVPVNPSSVDPMNWMFDPAITHGSFIS